jgi:hypothetical protein
MKKMVASGNVRNLFLIVLVVGAGMWMAARSFGIVFAVLINLAYIGSFLLLKGRPLAWYFFQALVFGVLLSLIWRMDTTSGLVPIPFTLAFVFCVYDLIEALAKRRTKTLQSKDAAGS